MIDYMQDDVEAFHRKFGLPIGHSPAVPQSLVKSLRYDLIREEAHETLNALVNDDLPEMADGIADLIYVLLGTAVSYGIDMGPIWDAVHASNMAKEGGPTRADGKILKPEGWSPPDVEGLLQAQMSN